MSILAQEHTVAERLKASTLIFLSIAATAAGITLLYLGMRSVMEIGGACAEGGPFVPRRPCPDGVPLLMMLGIWGGIAALAVYVWQTIKHKVPSLVAFAWPALFLSLGWNFLEFGLNPPGGHDGLAWGWLVCAVVFGIMGAGPLVIAFRPVMRGFSGSPPEQPMRPTDPVFKMAKVVRHPIQLKRTSASKVSTGATDDEELVAGLERLSELHRSGALTDAEFAAAKRRLIEGE